MKVMARELEDIKRQVDEARLKERANEKMFVLEEERDYFRFQVGKLDAEVRKLQTEIKSLKKALAEARDEIKNYKHICFSTGSFTQSWKKRQAALSRKSWKSIPRSSRSCSRRR